MDDIRIDTTPDSNITKRRRTFTICVGVVCVVLLVAAGIIWVARSKGSPVKTDVSTRKPATVLEVPAPIPTTGSMVLPLTGSLQVGELTRGPSTADMGSTAVGAMSVPPSTAQTTAKGTAATQGNGVGDSDAGPVDVPPGTSQTMQRLATHTSTDGVVVSTFFASYDQSVEDHGPVSYTGPPSSHATSPGVSGGSNIASSCSPAGEVTLELSDLQAVATFQEPFYSGFTSPLIDVQIGEFGVTEGKPATWVEAEVGPAAKEVEVSFADGSTDEAAPAGGVAVLAHLGDAQSAFGDGSQAWLSVLGTSDQMLAHYSIGIGNPPATPVTPVPYIPVVQPGNGASSHVGDKAAADKAHPADPVVATREITRSLTNALSCSEPPAMESLSVTDGGAYEEIGGAGALGMTSSDRISITGVTFADDTTADVRYEIVGPGDQAPQDQYADASLVGGKWLISLGSVAPGLQVTPGNQDGDVAVAPGGPLFTYTGSGGVAVAVYRAEPSGSEGNFCAGEGCAGAPIRSCIPTGGLVTEVTTPGAVGIGSGPLYSDYTTPLIGVGISIFGEAEGAPATIIGVEVGSSVKNVDLSIHGTTQSLDPVDGVVDAVLNGDPSTAIGSGGGSLSVIGESGQVLSSVPLSVDASEPAGATTLPSSLPASSGPQPTDPASATAAIDNAYDTVFSCTSPPIERSEDIQDNGLFTNPLEQLLIGPYTNLVESVYATVNQVVFASPTVADVDYTIRFHDDPTLSFHMIGTAVVVDGQWRVSYATLCAAVALGGVSCSS
ncbi:MAG: hypothetical protein WAM97_01405 [Acidimicrobiales bacterium]